MSEEGFVVFEGISIALKRDVVVAQGYMGTNRGVLE